MNILRMLMRRKKEEWALVFEKKGSATAHSIPAHTGHVR